MSFTAEEQTQELILRYSKDGQVLDQQRIAYPSCGYGGCFLIENPILCMVAVAMYSGESDCRLVIYKVIDGKLVKWMEEEPVFGEDMYRWSVNGTRLYRLLDSYKRNELAEEPKITGSYEVGELFIYDVLQQQKISKKIMYDFSNFDMSQLDAFQMGFSDQNGIVSVCMPGGQSIPAEDGDAYQTAVKKISFSPDEELNPEEEDRQEAAHQLQRATNRGKSWFAFQAICILMGVVMIPCSIMIMREGGPTAAALLLLLGGLGFLGGAIAVSEYKKNKKRKFIEGFLADPATEIYTDREQAAKTLFKLMWDYMEKEAFYSRYKAVYAKYWVKMFREELEAYRK